MQPKTYQLHTLLQLLGTVAQPLFQEVLKGKSSSSVRRGISRPQTRGTGSDISEDCSRINSNSPVAFSPRFIHSTSDCPPNKLNQREHSRLCIFVSTSLPGYCWVNSLLITGAFSLQLDLNTSFCCLLRHPSYFSSRTHQDIIHNVLRQQRNSQWQWRPSPATCLISGASAKFDLQGKRASEGLPTTTTTAVSPTSPICTK